MSNHPKYCIDCDEGTYELITVDYSDRDASGPEVVVPNVEILRCSHCGQELIPAETSKKISRAVAEADEQLTPEQLYGMLEDFDANQKQLAEICGFGEKTFHRWLKGTQTVSRSMGYYLRVLQRFPEAFAYVKSRAWREQPTSVSTQRIDETADRSEIESAEERFPSLYRRGFDSPPAHQNPAELFANSSL